MTYIAHYEVYRNYRTRRVLWEDKEFDTYEDADYYCAKMRKKYNLGAYVVTKGEYKNDTPPKVAEQCARTVAKYASMWNGF